MGRQRSDRAQRADLRATWNAAGLLPLFNLSYSVGQIHKYSVALYSMSAFAKSPTSGWLALATRYQYYAGVAATIGGIEVEFLTPAEVKAIWPLCNVAGVLGTIQHPQDGYIQPADVTQALARGARDRGAEINRQTTVVAIARARSGEWKVVTNKGEIRCKHVVSASGNFAKLTGRMVGLDVAKSS